MVQFDAVSSLLGGACIGLTAFYTFTLEGRVTGISGEAYQAVRNESPRSILFLSGLSLGSSLLAQTPFSVTGLEDALSPMPLPRIAVGAALVGVGASLANGCTSGHGICGLARLSKRSFAAVGTFMSTALVTASVLQSSMSAAAPPALDEMRRSIAPSSWLLIACMAGAPGLLGMLTGHARRTGKSALNGISHALLHVCRGGLFATGLVLSGMIHAGKTLSFLDVSGASPWDPSMAAVFAAALPLSYAGFRRVSASGCALQDAVSLPTNTTVDWRVVGGAALFGIGWGTVGICPGPAFAYFGARGGVKAAVALSCMVGGVVGARLAADASAHMTVSIKEETERED